MYMYMYVYMYMYTTHCNILHHTHTATQCNTTHSYVKHTNLLVFLNSCYYN